MNDYSNLEIYLARNNEQAGPYTLARLNSMLEDGTAVQTDLVWHAGLSGWQPLYRLLDGQKAYDPAHKAAPTEPVLAPPAGGKPAGRKAANDRRPAIETTTYILASYKRRLAAKIVDLSLLLPAFWVQELFIRDEWRDKYRQLTQTFLHDQSRESLQNLMAYAMQISSQIPEYYFWGIVAAVYAFQAYLLSRSAQSLGKMLVGIKIIDAASGQNAGFLQAFLNRSLLTSVLNWMTGLLYGGLDLLMGAGDSQKRFLHDRIARTLVVNKQPHAQTLKLTK